MRRTSKVFVWFVGLASLGSPAAAQELFAPWEETVDVSKYETVEECQAAVERVRRATDAREAIASGVWRDTLALDPKERPRALDDEVRETARRCLWRFADPDSAARHEFRFLTALYLYAGWEDKSRAAVERWMASVPPDAEDERLAVMDTVLNIYKGHGGGRVLAAPRPRIDLLDAFVDEYVSTIENRVERFRIYTEVAFTSESSVRVDTARIQRLTARIVALADSLSDEEREKAAERWGHLLSDGAGIGERFAGGAEFTFFRFGARDSLWHSTEAYARHMRRLWSRATGLPGETLLSLTGGGQPLGERAPEIEADFWLGCDGPCGPRPRPGRVSLVIFLSPGDCMRRVPDYDFEMYENCANHLIPLRRLMERFPEVEVTVVARTHGHFHYVKVEDPAEEARLTKRWLESYGVHAALAVKATDYWRLPNHDRRRIENPTINHENYTFGRRYPVAVSGTYLIDEDGLIVHIREMNWHSEAEFAELIRILLERTAARVS